jgi:lipopolysaccharide/colanic/teichoic acid biosynthesis glycosyltransferase
MKRIVDVVGALALLILTAPILAAAIVWIRARSHGSPIFRQIREGRYGQRFTMFKLRTMYENSEHSLPELLADDRIRAEWELYRRIKGDPRIIPGVGRWLRRTSLDELPQLWNVLRGDMSLVGPRPLEIEVADALPRRTMALRRTVRPGITGLWQVSGRSDHDLATLCSIDVEYVEHRSLRLDFLILARTAGAVFSGRGAY